MAARKTKKQTAAGWTEAKLKGKTLCFGGRWGKYDKAQPLELIERAGGKVAKQVAADVDYVVVNSSQSGTTSAAEKQALKLNQAGEASISVINEEDLVGLATPDRDEALAMLESPAGIKVLNTFLKELSLSIDVSGCKFDGAVLDSLSSGSWYRSSGLVINGCSFRKASLVGAHLSEGKGVCFDGADLTNGSVDNMENCSFKNAKMHKTNVYVAKGGCFDGADMTGAVVNTVSDCSFKRAVCRNMTIEPHTYHYRRGPAKVVNDFTGADLSAACFANASLGGSVFTGCAAQGSRLAKMQLDQGGFQQGGSLRGQPGRRRFQRCRFDRR